MGRHVAGVNRLKRTPLIAISAGENRWIANIVSIRSWNCVTRMIVWPRPDAANLSSTRSLAL